MLRRAAPGLSYPLLVAGEPPAPASATSGRRATPGQARFLGMLSADQLVALRERAMVFVAPARYEPSGLSILEAARDRCALVLGDIPPLREIWGDAALYVPPDDELVLSMTLERLLSSRATAAGFGASAQQRAARYSIAATAAAYGSLYRSLAGHEQRVAA